MVVYKCSRLECRGINHWEWLRKQLVLLNPITFRAAKNKCKGVFIDSLAYANHFVCICCVIAYSVLKYVYFILYSVITCDCLLLPEIKILFFLFLPYIFFLWNTHKCIDKVAHDIYNFPIRSFSFEKCWNTCILFLWKILFNVPNIFYIVTLS